VPTKPVQREPDGRLTVHLWLQQDGRFSGDVPLRLSPGEAELLHAQLCFVLDDAATASAAPDCRKPVHGSPGVHWP